MKIVEYNEIKKKNGKKYNANKIIQRKKKKKTEKKYYKDS